MQFDLQFIKNILPNASIPYATVPEDISFSIDTRSLQVGQVFLAVDGARVDGHDYVLEALKKGAAGLLINAHKKQVLKDIPAALLQDKLVVVVEDTLVAFTQLATAWRKQFSYPVVGITGSVGKTSTREILKTIFETNGMKCLTTQGNENTRLGVALNIFKMRAHHDVAIFELGISKRGEMAELVRIAKPTTALITNIGHAHMEGLGSLSDIAVEKRDIFKCFDESSIGIINGDQAILTHVGYAHPVIKFGSKTVNQIQARKIQITPDGVSFVLKIYKEKYTIVLPQPHEGIVFNTLAAVSVANLLNVPVAKIIEGIQKPMHVAGRYEQKALAGKKGTIIHDCYNANPESMKAALLAFQKIDTKAQKIAILGDMLELGVNAPFWHRQLGRFLRKVPSLHHVILVGDMVQWTKKTLSVTVSVEHVPSWKEAVERLQLKLDQESVVLVKGSRGIALDNLVKKFT